MARIMAKLALGFNAARPMNDERCRDTAFVDKHFGSAKRAISKVGPSAFHTKKGFSRTRRRVRVVPIAAYKTLGARAIVTEEKDQRVVQCIHRFELVQDTSDFLVHPVDHC